MVLVFRHTLSPITSFLDQGSSGTPEQNSTNSVNRRPFAWESWWDLLFNQKGQCSKRRSWGMRTIVCHNNQQASKCNLHHRGDPVDIFKPRFLARICLLALLKLPYRLNIRLPRIYLIQWNSMHQRIRLPQWPRNFMELPRMTVFFVSSGSWDHAELGKASTYGLSVQLVRLRSASTFRKLNAAWFPIGTCHDLTSIWQARLSETTPPSWIWNHGLSECSPAMPFPVMPWSGPQRKAKPAFPKTPRDVCKGWLREMVSRVLLLLGFDAHLFAFATCFCVLQCRGGTKRFRKATRTYADLTRVTQTPEGGHAVSFLVRKSIV